ncbi:putative BTB/POZ domain-containing protein [Raphanus sativus]|nr:putative BTB/POZ domain-containing protein [Raphanus sativus]
MACLKLGSKSEVFHLSGHTWICSTGLKPDVVIQVQDQTFHLHKFPLLSRSRYLEALFSKASETTSSHAQLHDIPGGPDTFLLVANFCYGVRIEVTAENVVSLRCAAEYLQMSENYGNANLVYLTESFLNDDVLTNWEDSIRALESCCERKLLLLPIAEELGIVSRCVYSLAVKASYAAEEETSLFNWPISEVTVWNGIRQQTKSTSGSSNWWFNDVSSFLDFSIYKRFIQTVASRGVKAEVIAASVVLGTLVLRRLQMKVVLVVVATLMTYTTLMTISEVCSKRSWSCSLAKITSLRRGSCSGFSGHRWFCTRVRSLEIISRGRSVCS